jgi:hypothetical protein
MVSANVEWCRGYCIGTVVSSGGSFSLCVRGARQRASILMPTMTSGIPRRRKSIVSTGNVSRCYRLIALSPSRPCTTAIDRLVTLLATWQ